MDTIDTMEIPMIDIEGLDTSDYEGLGSLIRAGLSRPSHIVRQSIPHNGQTTYAQYEAYKNYKVWARQKRAG